MAWVGAASPARTARAADVVAHARELVARGDGDLRAGKPCQACRAFERAATLLPAWWVPHARWLRCGVACAAPRAAVEYHARQAASLAPSIPSVQVAVARAWLALGRRAEAVAHLRAATERAPWMLDARLALARVLALSHASAQRKEAEAIARAVAERVGSPALRAVALRLVARLAELDGELERAAEAWAALAPSSPHPCAAWSRAYALARRAGDAALRRRARRGLDAACR